MRLPHLAQQRMMGEQQLAVAIAEPTEQRGRPLDVREHERDRPRRKLPHHRHHPKRPVRSACAGGGDHEPHVTAPSRRVNPRRTIALVVSRPRRPATSRSAVRAPRGQAVPSALRLRGSELGQTARGGAARDDRGVRSWSEEDVMMESVPLLDRAGRRDRQRPCPASTRAAHRATRVCAIRRTRRPSRRSSL